MHTAAHFTRHKKLNEVPKKLEPKYCIAELLRMTYGELNLKQGISDLTTHCLLKDVRTVTDWLKIEAGSHISINHLVLPRVTAFFSMQSEDQLFTAAHKQKLNPKTATND